MSYQPADLTPTGNVVSVITHHYRDHFDRGLFLARSDGASSARPASSPTCPRTAS